MKRIFSSSILIFVSLMLTTISANTTKDYTVSTSQAPVWGMQSETTPVIGWLVKGDVPESEVDEDDSQWVYVQTNGLSGWMHILSLRHKKSDIIDDQAWVDETFKDHLRELDVDKNVIQRVGEAAVSTEPTSTEPTSTEPTSTLVNTNKGVRGLEAAYVYIVSDNVECPVNVAYRKKSNMISLERDSQLFEAGYWFPSEAPITGTVMLMDAGKGFDMPQSAYHLLTEQEYKDYFAGILRLMHNPELGSLKNWLETHDIAQATDWNVELPALKKNISDLWPLSIPILLLLVVLLLDSVTRLSKPTIGWLWIALILIELCMAWQYISMPSKMFNDYGGLAWVPIAICTLLSLAIVAVTGYFIGVHALAEYDVEPRLKHALIGVGIGVAICIVVDFLMITVLGIPKDDVSLGVAGIIAIAAGFIGWMCYHLMSQNHRIAVALPSTLLVFTIALIAALIIAAALFFVVFAIVVWMFFSGYFNKGVKLPGLVGSERATCGKCSKYGTSRCPRSNVNSEDSPCDDFE